MVKKKVKKVTKNSLTIPVFGLDGKKKGTTSLPKEIFAVSASPKLLAQYVRVYLANQRQGTASTKTRSQVSGSTRKIYRQKGLGRARHGSVRAPIFVGGGVSGGPRPKDHSLKINKKQKRKAFFNALTVQNKEGNIIGLDDKSLETKAKTKTVFDFLNKLDFSGKKTVLVLPKLEKNNLVLAARNIPNVLLKDAKSLNAYDVLAVQKVIFLKEALKVLEKHFT